MNYIKKIISLMSIFYLTILNSFADGKGLLQGVSGGVSDIRQGNLDLDDVTGVIQGMIEIFLGLTGTVSVIFIIIGAYYLLFGSMKTDITKGRNTINMALTGFVISVLAWFIVRFIFDNFG